MFDKFKNRYIIEGELTAVTALHIGAAENVFKPSGCKNPFFRNGNDMPLIPGSSLKGAMRSFLEQYLSSQAGSNMLSEEKFHCLNYICNEEQPCADPNNDEELRKLLQHKKQDAGKKLSEYLFGVDKESKGKLCIICRLFGSHYSAAKFSVRDAGVKEESFHNEFEIRSGVSIDRDLGTSVDGQKFDTEVVPEGTIFSFRAVLENANDTEWEIIQQLLRAMNIGLIPIGGMKSRGLGEISLKNIKYQKIDDSNITTYLTGKPIEVKELFQEKQKEETSCSGN